MTVMLGAHDITAQEETQQVIPVAKAIPHPAYNPEDDSNDIMILKLERKAKMTKAVRPLKLPRRKVHVKPGDVCSVAGWGMMVPGGNYADRLQEVKMTIQNDQKCESYYRPYYNKANQICAGDPKIKTVSTLPSSNPSSLPEKMSPVLILLTFMLLLGAGAEEIIGGHEVSPHSRPYMAFIESLHVGGNKSRCGGFLVQDKFVLTAAHCMG
ncbi:hypothetical protein A6R68_13480, partial [Neotoma lepida]